MIPFALVFFVGLFAGMLWQRTLWQMICFATHGWLGRCVVEWMGEKIDGLKKESLRSLARQCRASAEDPAVRRKDLFEELAQMFERLAALL